MCTQKSNLRVHVRVKHMDERRFQCSECDLKFAYKSVLRRHIATIHGLGTSAGTPLAKVEANQEAGAGATQPGTAAPGRETANCSLGITLADTVLERNAANPSCGDVIVSNETSSVQSTGECPQDAERSTMYNGAREPSIGHKSLTHDPAATPRVEVAEPSEADHIRTPTAREKFLVDAVRVDLISLHKAPL